MPLKWRVRLFFWVLPLLIALTLFLTNIKADLSTFFVTGTSVEETLLANEMQSGKLSRQYIVSIGCNGATPPALDSFANRYAEAIKNVQGVASVWRPGQDQRLVDKLFPVYLPHASQIYSLEPEPYLDRLFTQEGLEQRAQLLKKSLLSLQGQRVKQIALQDPLLLTFSAFESFARRNQVKPERSIGYANFIIESSASGLAGAEQHQLQIDLQRLFTEQNTKSKIDCTLEMTGVPVFATATELMIKGDIQRVTVAASVGLVIVFLWIFRSLAALLWVSLVLVSATTGAMLVTTLLFGYIHGLTLAVGTTLIGICVDYPIHAIVHSFASANDQSRQQTVVKIWPSLLLGGITTIIGYTAMGMSGYPGFQQIAVYAGTGILVSLLFTRFILAGLMTDRSIDSSVSLGMGRWLRWCEKRRRLTLSLALICAASTVFSLLSVKWIDDLSELTPEMDHLKAQDQRIRARIASIEPGRFILVRGDDIETVLEKSEAIYAVLHRLQGKGAVKNYVGLYPWMVSEALQKRNQQALQKRMTAKFVERWRQALAMQGLSVQRLGDFSPRKRALLRPDEVLNSPANRLVSGQLVINDNRILAVIWLGQHDPDLVRKTLEDIEGVSYFSQRDLLNKLAAKYRKEAVKMLFAGLSVILLLLAIRFRSLSSGLRVLMPAVTAALFILTGLSYLGISLSFIHLVGFLLAVAVCVDYGIFFLENRFSNITLTYHAMAASMLTSAVAFGSLYLADNASLKALSITVALGVILGFLLCPVFIRPKRKNALSPTGNF